MSGARGRGVHRCPGPKLLSALRRGLADATDALVGAGGTFEDDPRLPQITLKWMVAGALDAGLMLRQGAYRKSCTVVAGNALGAVHRMGWIWGLLTYRHRRVPATVRVHHSVRDRITAEPAYRSRVPENAVWDDAAWLTARL